MLEYFSLLPLKYQKTKKIQRAQMAQTYKTILFSGGDSFLVAAVSFLCHGGRRWNDWSFLFIFTFLLLSYWALSVTVDGWVDTADRFSFLPPLGFGPSDGLTPLRGAGDQYLFEGKPRSVR